MSEPLAITPSSDVAFTPAVKAAQQARGSRQAYARVEARGGFRTELTPDFVQFLGGIDTAFLATANAAGQPYVQHRGGPKGFIRVLDARTLGMADFSGNRQYITVGNVSENPKAFLFLMDYTHRRRIKVWGELSVVEGDADLVARLMPEDYGAIPERALLFKVSAWDINCPQHIPQKIDAALVAAALQEREARIAALEMEVARLRGLVGADDAAGV
ncbi:pyridoxamine 5'-phosphate oxidase family protein [Xanthobacter sp. 126]|uniref:pyridoxamine 5'-phosphate oxidase family protein n=1 Tax=Xanthobacter sp. 126 TaxID=1131814 RepID=UPI00045EA86E|nr:pyridoxamine 5'-phosphate oxidase family protein [Xanthobacter sp. 126]